jgi:hypothetical protein
VKNDPVNFNDPSGLGSQGANLPGSFSWSTDNINFTERGIQDLVASQGWTSYGFEYLIGSHSGAYASTGVTIAQNQPRGAPSPRINGTLPSNWNFAAQNYLYYHAELSRLDPSNPLARPMMYDASSWVPSRAQQTEIFEAVYFARWAAAERIAQHSYWKHVIEQREFTATYRDFTSIVYETLARPSFSRDLQGGRTAYWNSSKNMIVFINPNNPARSTAFVPRQGISYFWEQKSKGN